MSVDRNLLNHYEKLAWHRRLVVEAIRVIAFRNRDHFYTSSVRLGVTSRADPDAITLVLDKMLQDQGKERSEEGRWVLGWANRAAWEVYMCMLYSHVESYRRIGHDDTSVAFSPLDDFLQSNGQLVSELKAVRDKLLHPQNATDYYDNLGSLSIAARHAAPDLYLALEQLQAHLDGTLERLQHVLRESLEDEVENLLPGEMAVYLRRFWDETRSRAEQAGSAEVLAVMDRDFDDVQALQRALRSHLSADFSLDDVPLDRVLRLEKTRDTLRMPLPKPPYHKSADSIQTPVTPELAAWVLMASFGGQVATLEERLPVNVMEHRSGVLELLVRSITVFNETFAALIDRYNAAYPNQPIETVLADEDSFMEALRQSTPTDTGAQLEQAMLEATPYRIALALLAEPLRIYRQVIQDQPQLSQDKIDSNTLDQAEEALRGLRNTIFHVPHGQADMFEADTRLAHAPISHGHYLDLVAGLTYFYQGVDPAVLSQFE